MQTLFLAARSQPATLVQFMHEFPKGGDIHHHLVGAPSPQMLLEVGVQRSFCLHPETLAATAEPCVAPALPFADVQNDALVRDRLASEWSMRDFGVGDDAAPPHFFGIFPKIWSLVDDRGLLLARLKQQAARENVLYLETQLQTPVSVDALRAIAMALPPTDDVTVLRSALMMRAEFDGLIKESLDTLEQYDATANAVLGCDSATPMAGCSVVHRYQFYALRILPTPMVLADMVLAFEVASRSDQVVGVNVVGFEGDATALGQYRVHMRALAALGALYPTVPMSLHAGEITPREADQDALQTHVPDALYIAGAKRIGHGNAIAQSASRETLLEDLAFTGTTVELSLTSNALLLGKIGENHHLPLLFKAGVPITLNTDDAGIFVTTLTREYVVAASQYAWLTYEDFKNLSRQSLIAAFIQGDSLWRKDRPGQRVPACTDLKSTRCGRFAAASPRAALQIELEKRFVYFEQRWRERELVAAARL